MDGFDILFHERSTILDHIEFLISQGMIETLVRHKRLGVQRDPPCETHLNFALLDVDVVNHLHAWHDRTHEDKREPDDEDDDDEEAEAGRALLKLGSVVARPAAAGLLVDLQALCLEEGGVGVLDLEVVPEVLGGLEERPVHDRADLVHKRYGAVHCEYRAVRELEALHEETLRIEHGVTLADLDPGDEPVDALEEVE